MTALLLLLQCSVVAQAEEPAEFPHVVQELESARIDWTLLKLYVDSRSDRTVGAWKDRRVQEQDALDSVGPRLVALAHELPVGPATQVSDLLAKGGELEISLEEGLQTWQVIETRYHRTGGVEMTAALSFGVWLQPAIEALVGPNPETLPVDGPTGILIDARGLPFQPAVVPRLETAEGQVLMDVNALGKDAGDRPIPVVFVTDPADPRVVGRVGKRPLMVRAGSALDSRLILSPQSPLALDPTVPVLVSARRVVVVLDP
jgi:hypothetical protein